MKKLASIAFIALFTLGVFAQEGQRNHRHHEFTTDQIAELKTKKMTLHLDLTEKQQQEILEINKRNAVEHKQKFQERKALKESDKKLTSDEIFDRKSQRLDKLITHKAEMKNILTDEQFEVWQKTRKHKAKKMKKRIAKRKMRQRKN